MHRAKSVYIDIKLPFRMSDRLIHDGASLFEQMLWKKDLFTMRKEFQYPLNYCMFNIYYRSTL